MIITKALCTSDGYRYIFGRIKWSKLCQELVTHNTIEISKITSCVTPHVTSSMSVSRYNPCFGVFSQQVTCVTR